MLIRFQQGLGSNCEAAGDRGSCRGPIRASSKLENKRSCEQKSTKLLTFKFGELTGRTEKRHPKFYPCRLSSRLKKSLLNQELILTCGNPSQSNLKNASPQRYDYYPDIVSFVS